MDSFATSNIPSRMGLSFEDLFETHPTEALTRAESLYGDKVDNNGQEPTGTEGVSETDNLFSDISVENLPSCKGSKANETIPPVAYGCLMETPRLVLSELANHGYFIDSSERHCNYLRFS